MSDLARLAEALNDPFEMFPVREALAGLGGVVAAAEERLYAQDVPSRKYRDVSVEMAVDALSNLIGAMFVVAQSAINRTVATLERTRDVLAAAPRRDPLRPAFLPAARHQLRALQNESINGIGDICVINAVADYFKHNDEWPSDWNTDDRRQGPTIEIVRTLGLSRGDPDNMLRAVHTLAPKISAAHLAISDRLVGWRDRLAEHVLSFGPPSEDKDRW